MKLYRREQYLKKIRPFYDDDIIKVITGIRRCGKSSLMETVIEELKERGVPDKDIVLIEDADAALDSALSGSSGILITGSFYLPGEMRKLRKCYEP